MSYCKTCKGLNIDELDDNDVPFHSKLSDLKSSARRCEFCRLFWQCILNSWQPGVIDSLLKGRPPFATHPDAGSGNGGGRKVAWDPTIWLRGECGGGRSTWQFPIKNGAGIWVSCGRLPLRHPLNSPKSKTLVARLSIYAYVRLHSGLLSPFHMLFLFFIIFRTIPLT